MGDAHAFHSSTRSSRIPRRVSSERPSFLNFIEEEDEDKVESNRQIKKQRRRSCERVVAAISDTLEAASSASMVEVVTASMAQEGCYVEESDDVGDIDGYKDFDEVLDAALANVDDDETPDWLFGGDGTATPE